MSSIVPYFVWSVWLCSTGCRPSIVYLVAGTYMWVSGHGWINFLYVSWGIAVQKRHGPVLVQGLGDLVLLVPTMWYPWPVLGVIWALGTRNLKLIKLAQLTYLISRVARLVF